MGPGDPNYDKVVAMLAFWQSHITPIELIDYSHGTWYFLLRDHHMWLDAAAVIATGAAFFTPVGWGAALVWVAVGLDAGNALIYLAEGDYTNAGIRGALLILGPIIGKAVHWVQGTRAAQKLFALGCFVAGTLVLTSDGIIPIDAVQPGDCVWSYDIESAEWVLCEVESTQEREYLGDLVTLTMELGDGTFDEITCTGGHPFWVIEGEQLAERPACSELPIHDSAMTASGRWTEARWLRLGDKFITRTGVSATVCGLAIRVERVKVYNLQVRDLELYGVGEAGVLVHNNSGGITIIGRGYAIKKWTGPGQPLKFEVVEGNNWQTALNNLRALRAAHKRGDIVWDISPADLGGFWKNHERAWWETIKECHQTPGKAP